MYPEINKSAWDKGFNIGFWVGVCFCSAFIVISFVIADYIDLF